MQIEVPGLAHQPMGQLVARGVMREPSVPLRGAGRYADRVLATFDRGFAPGIAQLSVKFERWPAPTAFTRRTWHVRILVRPIGRGGVDCFLIRGDGILFFCCSYRFQGLTERYRFDIITLQPMRQV